MIVFGKIIQEISRTFWFWLIFYFSQSGFSQQIKWAKLISLPLEDQINCIAQDTNGYLYAGGNTFRGMFFPGAVPRTVLYKLDSEGDTIFSFYPGYYGNISAIQQDKFGNLNIAVYKQGRFQGEYTELVILKMTPEGLIFQRDTIRNILRVTNSCIGKDSSWILCGYRRNDFNSNWEDFYVQRILKDGTIEPFVSLNPNHPSCRANRVEQLPNGKYLVSGFVGSRIASYTLNEDLSNAQFQIWYQTPDLSNLNSGFIGRSVLQNWMMAADGGPCFVANRDSLGNTIWIHKQQGTLFPPETMTDGSIIYGFSKNTFPYNVFYKRQLDSSLTWYINVNDSLLARGIIGNIRVSAYSYYQDQSAVIAGSIYQGSAVNDRDPFFMKVSNVGTPVTSLSKPKRGTLSNETLAPWPNPTSGSLYLKQHFDRAEIHFYTVGGKDMGSYGIRFGQPIDVSSITQGLYFYRAVIDGKAYSGRVLRR